VDIIGRIFYQKLENITYSLHFAELKFPQRELVLTPMLVGKISREKYFTNCFWDSEHNNYVAGSRARTRVLANLRH
jgi:hypothetical protein